MQNIDKIAFVVVGIIVVGLCSFALLFGGGEDHSESISAHAETIASTEDEQEVRKLGAELPEREKTIRAGFELGEAKPFPTWNFYRRPAVLEEVKQEVIAPAEHGEPQLLAVEVIRDAEARRAMHVVRGRAGDSKRIKNLRLFLEIKPEGESWSELHQIEPAMMGEEFSLTVDPKPRGKYHYRVRSEAMGATQPLPEDRKIVFSGESPATLLPPNYSLKASACQLGQPGPTGDWQPGRANITIRYWDYDSNSVKQKQRVFIEPDLNEEVAATKDVFPEILGSGRKLTTIKKGDKTRTAEIKDLETRVKESLINGKDGVPLEVSAWENPNLSGEGDDPEDSEGTAEPETASDEPAEPAAGDAPGAGLFGDDDD